MSLDHDSGTMDGEVLRGRFAGRRLSDLDVAQLIDLLAECRGADGQSASVLEAYLDRTWGPDWRKNEGAETGDQEGPLPNGGMTTAEAYEILGLQPGASEETIIEAHRRLMQRLHPDRGGSTYLAAKINQAKDLLLGS